VARSPFGDNIEQAAGLDDRVGAPGTPYPLDTAKTRRNTMTMSPQATAGALVLVNWIIKY